MSTPRNALLAHQFSTRTSAPRDTVASTWLVMIEEAADLTRDDFGGHIDWVAVTERQIFLHAQNTAHRRSRTLEEIEAECPVVMHEANGATWIRQEGHIRVLSQQFLKLHQHATVIVAECGAACKPAADIVVGRRRRRIEAFPEETESEAETTNEKEREATPPTQATPSTQATPPTQATPSTHSTPSTEAQNSPTAQPPVNMDVLTAFRRSRAVLGEKQRLQKVAAGLQTRIVAVEASRKGFLETEREKMRQTYQAMGIKPVSQIVETTARTILALSPDEQARAVAIAAIQREEAECAKANQSVDRLADEIVRARASWNAAQNRAFEFLLGVRAE